MKRRDLYILYAVLWAFTIWLCYFIKPHGSGSLGTLFLYGPPVFALYLLSLFLMDVREQRIDRSMVAPFLRKRRVAIGLFCFGMIVLILLIFS